MRIVRHPGEDPDDTIGRTLMSFARLGATFFVAAAAFAAPAFAQSQIDKPECVAPANPGGGFDLTCRNPYR